MPLLKSFYDMNVLLRYQVLRYYRCHWNKSLPLGPDLNKSNLIYITTIDLITTHLNITLPYPIRSPK